MAHQDVDLSALKLDMAGSPNWTNPAQNKTTKHRWLFLAGLAFVGGAVTLGFALSTQTPNNYAPEILRALEETDLLQVSVQVSGPLAKNGDTQTYKMWIIPDSLNEKQTRMQALMQYTEGNDTVEIRMHQDDQVFSEMYDRNGTLQLTRCLTQMDVPAIGVIANSIMYAKVIPTDEYDPSKCPEGKVVYTWWSFVHVWACIDTSSATDGRILRLWGPHLDVEVQYLDYDADTVALVERKPTDLDCTPWQLATSRRRLVDVASTMVDPSYFDYDDFYDGIADYAHDLDSMVIMDPLVLNNLVLDRRKLKMGYARCVFIHGAGVLDPGQAIEYWGAD